MYQAAWISTAAPVTDGSVRISREDFLPFGAEVRVPQLEKPCKAEGSWVCAAYLGPSTDVSGGSRVAELCPAGAAGGRLGVEWLLHRTREVTSVRPVHRGDQPTDADRRVRYAAAPRAECAAQLPRWRRDTHEGEPKREEEHQEGEET